MEIVAFVVWIHADKYCCFDNVKDIDIIDFTCS